MGLRLFSRIVRKDGEIYFLKLLTLSIALASSILIIAFSTREFGVDRFYGPKVARLLIRHDGADYVGKNRLTNRIPPLVFDQLNLGPHATLARVKTLSRVTVISGSGTFPNETIHTADTSLIKIFPFTILDESTSHTVDGPAILLSETYANRYFSNAPAVGRQVRLRTWGDTISVRVAAVFRDFPSNTSEDFNAFLAWDASLLNRLHFDVTDNGVYARIADKQSKAAVEQIVEQQPLGTDVTVRFQSVSEIYFGPRVIGENVRHGDSYSILILICISALIFFLALTNFVNLSTLTLPARAKEFALKKVSGAGRIHLLVTLLSESLVLSTLALLAGVLLLLAAIGPLKAKLSIDVLPWLTELTTEGAAYIAILFLVVVLSPLYPALKFIRASPNRLLSTDVITFPRLKRVITVLQLGISLSLIVAGLIVHRQIGRSLIKEPGKNHEQLVYLRYPPGLNIYQLRGGWARSNPNISGVTATSHLPDNLSGQVGISDAFVMSVDEDFPAVFDLSINGRWFGINDQDSVVVNEKAWEMGLTGGNAPIGTMQNFASRFNQPDQPLKIIKVGDFNYLWIRILEVDIRKTLDYLGRYFLETTGRKTPLTFLNASFNDVLAYENTLNRLSAVLSITSGLMACCAIYALSISRIRDSMKQIAIRKTFGATNQHIVFMISADFLKLLMGAVFFIGPVTFFLLREWLRNFAYATRLTLSDPLIALAICIVIVMLTNSSLMLRLNRANIMATLRD